MTGYTVQVKNVSSRATVRDIRNFFSFSGPIEDIELCRDGQWSQVAFVTFKDPDALDTAVLLSGATIIDQPVSITSLEDQDQEAAWEHDAVQPVVRQSISTPVEVVTRAQDMVTSMVSKGFLLSKDALNKAKAFEEKHQFTANASSRVASVNKKIGLSEKWNAGTSTVNKRVQAVNDRYQITEKTRTAFALAHQGVSSAGVAIVNNGSALMNNRYILKGGSLVSDAFRKVAKAASDVTFRGKEQRHYEEMPRLSAEA